MTSIEPVRAQMKRKKKFCTVAQREFESCGFRDFQQDFWPGFSGCHTCAEKNGAFEAAAAPASMVETNAGGNHRFAARAPVNSIVAAIATAHGLEAARKGLAKIERQQSTAKRTLSQAGSR